MYRVVNLRTHRPNDEYFIQQWNPESGRWEFPEGLDLFMGIGSRFGLEAFESSSIQDPVVPGGALCAKDPAAAYRLINWLNGGSGELPSKD